MTDPELADATYVEPITPAVVEKILEKERPDAILPTMGGQTALNIAVALAETGVLKKYGVELSAPNLKQSKKPKTGSCFRKRCGKLVSRHLAGNLSIRSTKRWKLPRRSDYRLSFAHRSRWGEREAALHTISKNFGRKLSMVSRSSPIHQVLVEESVIGWKEYELEVMRDLKDNVVIICSIENFDPDGSAHRGLNHVAPAQTLTDKEYQMMRDAAIKIIQANRSRDRRDQTFSLRSIRQTEDDQ